MTRSAPLKTVRGQLRRAVSDARSAGRMSAALEVDALLADRLASVVDGSEGQDLVRAVVQLRSLLDRLPLEGPVVPAPAGGSRDNDGGRGAVVLELDRPPAVGNAAHTG